MIDSGDTAFILACTALVLIMTFGLAIFYAGMVRSKSALGMLMQTVICVVAASIAWLCVGYTLAFGEDVGGGLVGDFSFIGFTGMGEPIPGIDVTIPPVLFATFQMMFAILTVALVAGAVADRVRFGPFVAFATLWVIVVYAPVAHWVFSPGGWMNDLGILDFAGGMVVEINCGMGGLALALVAGRRLGWPKEAMPPHNLLLVMLGAGLLWFGWFGFNAGSALAADGVAASALLNTHLSGCGGMAAWLLVEKLRTGAATTLGGASGAVAGLVAITPSCGYLHPFPALLVGIAAGVAAFYAVQLKNRLGVYDDSLDVVGVHYIGGVVGMLFIGLFASTTINGGVVDEGLLLGGGATQLGKQALGVLAATAYAFVVSYLLALLVDKVMPLRVTEEQERAGLDQTIHAEQAYDLGSVRTLGRS